MTSYGCLKNVRGGGTGCLLITADWPSELETRREVCIFSHTSITGVPTDLRRLNLLYILTITGSYPGFLWGLFNFDPVCYYIQYPCYQYGRRDWSYTRECCILADSSMQLNQIYSYLQVQHKTIFVWFTPCVWHTQAALLQRILILPE